jgi:hypothetical protein
MRYWRNSINTSQAQRSYYLYKQHLTNLYLQGKRPFTIDTYSKALTGWLFHGDVHSHLHIIVPNSGYDPERKKWQSQWHVFKKEA